MRNRGGWGGGESGIRTHGTVNRTPVFETGAFVRSAISPWRVLYGIFAALTIAAAGAIGVGGGDFAPARGAGGCQGWDLGYISGDF